MAKIGSASYPLMIKATNLELTKEMRDYVEKKFSGLNKYFTKIIEMRVEVEHDPHHLKGNVYRCEVNVKIPRDLLRVEKRTSDFYKAVDKVRDHLKVVLARHKKKLADKQRRRSLRK